MSPDYNTNPVEKPVNHTLLTNLCEQLGYDPADVAEILLTPTRVEVLTYQRDSKGAIITNVVPLSALQRQGIARGYDTGRKRVPATVLHVHKVVDR